ncbi:acyl carrier protein [Lentzea sp. NPDC051213]|uniref:acyl carrier protein n=1 Tax=Lentzea sp. NPDC051213 TaxID=3364126 RepID=UPI0037AE4087
MNTESTTRDQIASVTAGYLAAELKISAAGISGTDVLRDMPGADSMKMLRVVSKLEREWKVEFDDEEIFAATTVDELITLVEKNVNRDLAIS